MAKIFRRFDESEPTRAIKLDKRDYKILTTLAKNARIPLTKIAKMVNLSRDSVNYRIKRMQEKGFLLMFTPIINTNIFGYDSYHIFLLLEESRKDKRGQLLKNLKEDPHVKEIMEYSDRWDLEVVLISKTIHDLDKLKERLFNKYSDIILEKSTLETIKVYTSNFFPIRHFDETFTMGKKRELGDVKHDSIDIKILRMLSQDCRRSTYNIGREIGLNADTIGTRIKRMLKDGIIEKFTIIVNLNMLGFHWYTFAMQNSALDERSDRKLRTFSSNSRNIIRASKMLGSFDVLFYLLSDSTTGFHRTIKQLKSEFSDVIKSYETWIAYKEHYFESFPEIIHG